jgi:hypothetical protein
MAREATPMRPTSLANWAVSAFVTSASAISVLLPVILFVVVS